MSLNGLESPEVVQIFTTSSSEPAGWFLLKYASRDTVELLGSGTAGVFEARMCMGNYEEKSPLYGLIMFRRKRVLIKYIPEGTSRLLQVRTTVHFKDVVEKYSPYDALLDISTADGLSDTNLAATFPLHAGAVSVSQKQLDEITEDAEEPASPPSRPATASPAPSKMSRKAALDRMAAYKRSVPIVPKLPPEPKLQTPVDSPVAASGESIADPQVVDAAAVPLPDPAPAIASTADEHRQDRSMDQSSVSTEPTLDTSQLELTDTSGTASISERPKSPSPFNSARSPAEGRPDSAVLQDIGLFDYRPKIKLAPRPVQIADRQKPGQMPMMARRATATLPSRIQIRHRVVDGILPRSMVPPAATVETPSNHPFDVQAPAAIAMEEATQAPDAAPTEVTAKVQPRLAATMDAPESPTQMQILPLTNVSSRPPSEASVRSGKQLRPKTPLTPQKQRLLKAVEMRRRHLRQVQRSSAPQSPTSSAILPPPPGTPIPTSVGDVISESDPRDSADLVHDARASMSKTSVPSANAPVEVARPEDGNGGVTQGAIGLNELPEPTPSTDASPTGTLGEQPAGPSAAEEPAEEVDSHLSDTQPEAEGSFTRQTPEEEEVPTKDSPWIDPILGGESPVSEFNHSNLEDNVRQDPAEGSILEAIDGRSNASDAVEDPKTTEQATTAKEDPDEQLVPEADNDEATPPAVQIDTTAYLDGADSARDVSLASTEGYGKTALYEDSISTQGGPRHQEGFFDTASEKSCVRNTWLSDATELQERSSSPESMHRNDDSQRQKRRGIIAPLALPTESTPGARTGSIDDEDFEYFGDATVHEATSLSVLRTPATPVVASRGSAPSLGSSPTSRATTPNEKATLERTKTSPLVQTTSSKDLNVEDPRATMRRTKTSTTNLQLDTESLVSSSRKGQIGSGISQRIAKLAESRSREGSPLPSPNALPSPSISNTGLFSRSLFSGRPNTSAATSPDLLKGRLRSMGLTSGVKETQKAATAAPTESNAYYTVHTDPATRRQSVSVTAKIVRPTTRTYNEAPAELETTNTAFDPSADTRRPMDPPPAPGRRDRSIASTISRRSIDSAKFKRFSFNRAKSHDSRLDSTVVSNTSNIAPPRAPSPTKLDSPSPNPSKRDRTSRFLKRMSGLSAVSRKRQSKADAQSQNLAVPSTIPSLPYSPDKPLPAEPPFSLEGLGPSLTEGTPSPLPSIRIGDVNVQFPHSGLWKRRFVEIDHQGVLTFSVNDKSSYSTRHGNVPMSTFNPGGRRAGTKEWDLREVSKVYVPRVEDMELAHSVVLELEEGEVVVACEDGRGQREVYNGEFSNAR
ncbi:hypothetical protein CAC42_2541 [Sphaceloma murrayae]|uniref:ADF-H domain-containing protein n=1 Tax=Sphaceloma murrayae TaxID=2082308 RepID=A0A2K1QWD5_9PEZI|nr:hypothetical protein CAC42_2541 [Sphaceloma murrayae]